jgi:hypothetical protein
LQNSFPVSDEIKEIFSPTILFKDDLLGISLLNPDAKDVKIELFDYRGNELISDMHQEKQNVAVRYNLTQLPMGTYTLIVKTNNRTYLKDLVL